MALDYLPPPPVPEESGSVSLLIDEDAGALVVLHGAIGVDVHSEVREVVADLESDVARRGGAPRSRPG